MKIQGIKTKAIPFIRDSVEWSGSGRWIEPFVGPLGSDTKVISALFEIVARQAVISYADRAGMRLVEPTKQNHYPDFTLMRNEKDQGKSPLM